MRRIIADSKVIYLHPGEVIYSSSPIVVSTVLGSCLSVTMFNPDIKFGGISHCQLPNCRSKNGSHSDCKEPFKYVNCTIKKMLEKFESKGIDRERIEVKVFGGADVLRKVNGSKIIDTVGMQNINSSYKMIKTYNLNLKASDVGGSKGRKIYFFSNKGEIYLTKLKNAVND